MRLWHKDLIKVLPRQQLVGQWRECCSIARDISELGKTNHILINKVMDYPIEHLWYYGKLVSAEMCRRGYICNFKKFKDWFLSEKPLVTQGSLDLHSPSYEELFKYWHTGRYLLQCVYNLEEKYDCGGITLEEWAKILKSVPFPSLKEKAV